MSDARPSGSEAWRRLEEGNARFADGRSAHPRQDSARRAAVAGSQTPTAAVVGCSDSRVAPELLFDQGLGDLFVVRNAGQVADAAAIASVEYAVAVLRVPLVVVLAHDGCGAVRAAIDAASPDAPPLPPLIAAHVDRIRQAVDAAVPRDAAAVGRAHLEATAGTLLAASELLSAAVADGSVTVVGAEYRLADGRVRRRLAVGDPG